MNKILEIKFGSHLYGTSTPSSDLDFKGIYLPTDREIVLGNYKKTITTSRPKQSGERNTKDDVDTELFSLDRFLELLCDGQTVALDMLFAPLSMYTHDAYEAWIMRFIQHNKHEFLSKNVNAFVGYARQQAAKYGIKGTRMDALKNTLDTLKPFESTEYFLKLNDIKYTLECLVNENKNLISLEKEPLIEIVEINGPHGKPEPHLHVAGRKIPFHATVKYAKQIFNKVYEGYGQRSVKAQLDGGRDYKALSHAVRVNAEAKELLETGRITFPRPEADLLLKIKKNELPFDQVSEIIETGLSDLMVAQEKSTLREEPNRDFAEDLVYRVYGQIVKDED